MIDPVSGFVSCAPVPELASVWCVTLAPWFGIGKSDHAETIPQGGKAGGQIDQSRGNGVADIQAHEEIHPADAAWPAHVLVIHVE
jgi:hypothetical protein